MTQQEFESKVNEVMALISPEKKKEVEELFRTHEEYVAVKKIEQIVEARRHIEEDDILYAKVVEYVKETGNSSISSLQRHFGIGYARSGMMIDRLKEDGIIPYALDNDAPIRNVIKD